MNQSPGSGGVSSQVSDLSEMGHGPGLQEMSKIMWKEGEWPETQLLKERKVTFTTTDDFENNVKLDLAFNRGILSLIQDRTRMGKIVLDLTVHLSTWMGRGVILRPLGTWLLPLLEVLGGW